MARGSSGISVRAAMGDKSETLEELLQDLEEAQKRLAVLRKKAHALAERLKVEREDLDRRRVSKPPPKRR